MTWSLKGSMLKLQTALWCCSPSTGHLHSKSCTITYRNEKFTPFRNQLTSKDRSEIIAKHTLDYSIMVLCHGSHDATGFTIFLSGHGSVVCIWWYYNIIVVCKYMKNKWWIINYFDIIPIWIIYASYMYLNEFLLPVYLF